MPPRALRGESESTEGEDEMEDFEPRAKRVRRGGSESLKEARMLRNRLAAQASRDKKRAHVEGLESRLAELEAELSSSKRQPSEPSTSLLPPPPNLALLEQENEHLRFQIHQEQAATAVLQSRLQELETRFVFLEQAMRLSALPPLPPPTPAAYSNTPLPPPTSLPELPLPVFDMTTSSLPSFEELLPMTPHPSTPNTTTREIEDLPCLTARELLPQRDSFIDTSTPVSPPTTSLAVGSGDLDIHQLTADDIKEIWAGWENGLPVLTGDAGTEVDSPKGERFFEDDSGRTSGFWSCFEENENSEALFV